MADVAQMVSALTCPLDKTAYGALKELIVLSQQSDQVYQHFDHFMSMLDDPNSYVRSRGLALMAHNAHWDSAGKLEDGALDAYLAHILDDKPITARQCIQNLRCILEAKPALAPAIEAALEGADFSRYPDSMSPLLMKDAAKILKQIAALGIA